MRVLMLLVLVVCGIGFISQNVFSSQTSSIFRFQNQNRQANEDNIREAVFRHQFLNNASGLQQNAKVYFLSVGKDKEPTDDFMKRFAEHKPPVKKASESKYDDGIKDKKTGANGLIFSVDSIEWKNDDEVTVGGGYYEGNLSSSGNTYTVVRKNGKWTVVKDEMNWIS